MAFSLRIACFLVSVYYLEVATQDNDVSFPLPKLVPKAADASDITMKYTTCGQGMITSLKASSSYTTTSLLGCAVICTSYRFSGHRCRGYNYRPIMTYDNCDVFVDTIMSNSCDATTQEYGSVFLKAICMA